MTDGAVLETFVSRHSNAAYRVVAHSRDTFAVAFDSLAKAAKWAEGVIAYDSEAVVAFSLIPSTPQGEATR